MALFLDTQLSFMRKIFVIGLIAVHLLGNTDLNQLVKLPKLISHFIQHQRQIPELSFIDFIAMHYGGNDGTTADDNEDSKLPFHNGTSLSGTFAAYLTTLIHADHLNWISKRNSTVGFLWATHPNMFLLF